VHILASVFARLEAFLPTMREANDKLAEQHAEDPQSADIENLTDPEGQHIEMVCAITNGPGSAGPNDALPLPRRTWRVVCLI
jgi:hypothetical protein